MLDYNKLKEKWKEWRPKAILGVCFVLVFIVGFGSGRYDKNLQSRKKTNQTQNNYNTQIKSEKVEIPAAVEVKSAVATTTSGSCLIKGNISTKGKKVYHIPGGAYYNITKPEQCFATEAEAQASGYVKSSR